MIWGTCVAGHAVSFVPSGYSAERISRSRWQLAQRDVGIIGVYRTLGDAREAAEVVEELATNPESNPHDV